MRFGHGCWFWLPCAFWFPVGFLARRTYWGQNRRISVSETDALLTRPTVTSKQPASSKNGSVVITVDWNELGINLLGNNAMYWTKLVMDMYPPGTSARIEQERIHVTPRFWQRGKRRWQHASCKREGVRTAL